MIKWNVRSIIMWSDEDLEKALNEIEAKSGEMIVIKLYEGRDAKIIWKEKVEEKKEENAERNTKQISRSKSKAAS